MLFSEPKIPQFGEIVRSNEAAVMFQCSSASRKFLNARVARERDFALVGFSALQRAENSSIGLGTLAQYETDGFSALQRAENSSIAPAIAAAARIACFSALQRAENSSIAGDQYRAGDLRGVSVLFSEPKIPQYIDYAHILPQPARFSALQRAENSSIYAPGAGEPGSSEFQCSSASRKFLNPRGRARAPDGLSVSVLFSEPKIPQSACATVTIPRYSRFSALQRAENSSIQPIHYPAQLRTGVSVLFSEPKIPQLSSTSQHEQRRAVSVLFSEPKIPQS